MYIATRLGYTATGINPDRGYSELAGKAYGVTIKTADIDVLESELADIGTLFHVLEHLSRPDRAIERIARCGKMVLQKDASPHNIYFRAHLCYFSVHRLLVK